MLCKKIEPGKKTASQSVDARASRLLKNFIRQKITKVVVLFRRREIAAVTNTDQKKIFPSCTIF